MNRTQAQKNRQDHRGIRGRYAKVNPCYVCVKSAGDNYFSHPLTDTGEWHDIALCLCLKCANKVDHMTDPEEFLAYQKSVMEKRFNALK